MGAPFVYRAPVRFADVDHAGIVYYPRFFHFFHVAFEEFFRERMGARAYVELLDEQRIGLPAVNASCNYLSPLRFGDEFDVALRVVRLGARSVTFGYRVWRVADDGEPVLAAEGENVCAIVDLSEFRAVAMPETLRALLEPLAE